MACQCVVVVEEFCEWNDVCDSLITWFCVVCCLFVIRINANVYEIVWMPDLLRPPVWVCGGNLCLPQLATSGLQYHESGSPIVQQISRYGDTPKYADMVDRDIGDIYRHMSNDDDRIIQWQTTLIHKTGQYIKSKYMYVTEGWQTFNSQQCKRLFKIIPLACTLYKIASGCC